jgi:hypothetical protein
VNRSSNSSFKGDDKGRRGRKRRGRGKH